MPPMSTLGEGHPHTPFRQVLPSLQRSPQVEQFWSVPNSHDGVGSTQSPSWFGTWGLVQVQLPSLQLLPPVQRSEHALQ